VRRLREHRSDGGFTLVELLVYMLLLGIVGTIVVTLLWNGVRTQLNVTETTNNTGNVQTAARAIDQDVRYSSAYAIRQSGSMLLVRTWIGDPETGKFVCRGWFYDSSAKALRRTTLQSATSTASLTSARTWDIYVRGVEASAPFSESAAGTVVIRLAGTPQSWGRATEIESTVSQRPQTEQGSAPCF